MAKKMIRLTDKMAEALSNTIEINGSQTMIMSHPRTQGALTRIGLADEHGQLTDAGRFVAWLISVGDDTRSWTHEGLAAGTRTWMRDQERRRWPNRLILEEALAEAHTEWRMGEPAVVRIAYADGTTEECRNIPTGAMAAGIFAEAVFNDRVVKAELARGDGTVAAKYPRDPMPRADVVDGVCGRHMGEELARRYGRRTLSACARVPGHRGRHFAALNGVKWTDDQCAPSTTEELAKRAGLDL